jgi:hypothetical protein
MNRRTLIASCLAVVPALFVAAPSDAGQGITYSAGAYCGKNADGSGYCSGSLSGFLHSSDPSAYAAFWNQGPVYGSFSAELANTWYSCTMENLPQQWFAITSAPTPTEFYISWSAQGQCTFLSIEAQSNIQ